MRGQTLFVGVGTGLDIAHFPVGPIITAIDISKDMLGRAMRHRDRYLAAVEQRGGASLELCLMDGALTFADQSFDTVATACTLCLYRTHRGCFASCDESCAPVVEC